METTNQTLDQTTIPKPSVVNNAALPKSEDRQVEKFLMVLLFFITVTQFSAWGYQAVIYILGLVFNVSVVSTPLDVIVGLIAMVGSVFVFAGAAMWWRLNEGALPYLRIGSMLFIAKNIIDLFNETILFSNSQVITNQEQIQQLATTLGDQFFQLAFWVFVLVYVKYKIENRQK